MSKQKTLWILNHYAGNLELGMEYRHFYLARHLKKLGWRVGIISGSFHHLYTTPPKVDGDLAVAEFDGIPYVFLKTRAYKGNGVSRLLGMLDYLFGIFRHLSDLEQILGRPDIALGSTPHPFVHFALQAIKKKFKVPVFFEVRDLWPQMLVELGSIGKYHPLSLFFYWLEREAFAKSDKTVSLWHSADEYMFAHGLSRDRYIYLPNGIELDEEKTLTPDNDHPLVSQVRKLKSEGVFVAGYGGSHGHANALDCVIGACERLKNEKIVFFCVGDGPERERLMAEAQKRELKNLHFHPYVSKSVILPFYRELDAAYIGLIDLPLFKYGPTPNKLMDYFSMGKPVIFAINSRFDPVREANAGISIRPKADELANALLEMKKKSMTEREAMGKNGRRYAERELSFEALALRLSGHMDEAIGATDTIKRAA